MTQVRNRLSGKSKALFDEFDSAAQHYSTMCEFGAEKHYQECKRALEVYILGLQARLKRERERNRNRKHG